ncbi:MAG: SGNH/GDSL hydrolase family protein, partial [Gammaproteobacteria bacterium]|nr:SGNH/GDSL hydrolase family protein [Gammaproteobacteria bacterium]
MKLNRSYLLSIILLCFSLSVEAQRNYSAMYVFGDSLSDTGNLAAYLHSTGVLDPSEQLPFPYYQNRISNGPVAVDHIAETLALSVIPSLMGGTNYAVAGAKAGGDTLADLPAQLELFVANHSVAGVTDIPQDALYIVFIGGNDVRAARGEIDTSSARKIIRKAVDNIGHAVRALISAGARHIMVVNSPDIGKIPETLMAAEAGIVWLPALSTWRTKQFNFRLFLTLMRVQWETGVKLIQ